MASSNSCCRAINNGVARVDLYSVALLQKGAGLANLQYVYLKLFFSVRIETGVTSLTAARLGYEVWIFINESVRIIVERGEISDASAVDGSRIPIRPTPNGD